ncbi:MAG: beta-lactamase family protein [Verrucomicrobia bacterium]|nr:beta-lactamase family protein [Verrucomicrobiota bacterium]
MKPGALHVAVLFAFLTAPFGYADQIDNLVRNEMEKRRIPGLALGIVHKGKEIRREYGYANLEHSVPVKPDTVFEIGNITGQFTASAIMILAEEGRLSLGDRITKHLPSAPTAWNKITVQDLLNGTSGIRNYAMQPGFEITKRLSQAQFIELLAVSPLEFQPGEKAEYTVSSYALLGFIVENITKQNFWVFAAERIFSPLGMTASGDREPRVVVANRASGYTRNRSGAGWTNRDSDLTDMGAAGSMISTVDDLLKWDASLNSERILTRSSRDLMWKPGKLNNGKEHSFGFGCRIEHYKIYIHLLHTGSTGGFSSSYSRFPEPGLSIVVLANGGDVSSATTISKAIAAIYLE